MEGVIFCYPGRCETLLCDTHCQVVWCYGVRDWGKVKEIVNMVEVENVMKANQAIPGTGRDSFPRSYVYY